MKTLLLVSIGTLTTLAASAQTTVFYDNFTGPWGEFGGTAPTTGSGTWNAPSYIGQSGGGVLNAREAGSGAAASTSYLSTSLSSGFIYELSVDIVASAPTSTSSQYVGFGFFSDVDKTWTRFDNQSVAASTPWSYLQTQSATNLGDMSFRPDGQYIDGVSDIDSNFDVTVSQNYKLVLNTSDTDSEAAGDQFSVSLYVDGVQFGSTYTYDAIASAALLTDVVGVGLTANIINGGANASFDNFLLTSTAVIPEPSTFALLAGLGTLGAVAIRRKRK